VPHLLQSTGQSGLTNRWSAGRHSACSGCLTASEGVCDAWCNRHVSVRRQLR
jgi:hypothetical protein